MEWMVHDGRLVAGQESSSSSATSSRQSFTKHFKTASRAFAEVEGSFSDAEPKAASQMQNLKRWQRVRTDWPGGFLPHTARSGQHAQWKQHLDQRGEQKTWDCASSNGAETAAPWVGEKDPRTVFMAHRLCGNGRNLRSRLSQLPLSLNDSVARHLGTAARHSLQFGGSQLPAAFEHRVHVVLCHR